MKLSLTKTTRITIAAILAMIAGLVIYFTDPIDRCLDRGGCWDSVDKVCRNTKKSNEQAMCDRGTEIKVGE